MPFQSKAQARWMFANKPKMAKEWASVTPSIKKLPNRVKKSKSSGSKPVTAPAYQKRTKVSRIPYPPTMFS